LAQTVQTDKADYPPGSTVIITGNGFQPNESVQLQVINLTNPDDTGDEHSPWTVTADENGSFTAFWYVTQDEADTTLKLTATGNAGSFAEMTFTDASDLTVSGTVQFAGTGAAVAGATITGYSDAALTTVDNNQGPGAGTTTSAANGTWTLHLQKSTTRYVVVSGFLAGTNASGVTLGSGGSPVQISTNEIQFSSGGGGDTSSGNLFLVKVTATVASGLTANNKVYDGSTVATIVSNNVTLSGIRSTDAANVKLSTNGYSAAFATATIGTSKSVSVSGLTLTGTAAGNYFLTQPTLSADITTRSVLITNVTASAKIYDGTTSATLNGGAVSNIVSGDTVTFTTGTGAFSSQYVGTWPVTATSYALSTSGVSTNYALSAQPTVPNASISTRSVLITNVMAANKTYDATTTATLSGGAVSNSVSGDSVTFTAGTGVFASKNIGTWGVTTTGYALTPNTVATNYSLSAQPLVPSATISATNISVTANNDSKTYGQTKTYGTGQTAFTSSGLQGGETIGSVTITASGGINANSTVGTYNLTPSAATGGTFAASNYSITYNNGTLTVNKANSSVAVASTLNPSGYKAAVNFTATLPSDATGNVIFTTTNAPFSTNALSSGSATSLSITNLPRGTNTITAQYAGDSNYLGSTNTLAIGQIVTNHPPVAASFSVTNSVNTFKMTISDLLTNATDADSDTLALAGFSASTNGVTIATNAVLFQYRNSNNVNDRFNYIVLDGFGGSATGTVSVVFYPFGNNVTGQQGTITPVAGVAHLKYFGIPTYKYIIQRSTNMVNWVSLQTTNTPSNGTFDYDDNFSDLGGAPSSAFYRLVWTP
jgi:hypothetical protein